MVDLLITVLVAVGLFAAGLIAGYEMHRLARAGSPLIRLPKWKKKTDKQPEGKYGL